MSQVLSVSRSSAHTFSKPTVEEIQLLTGLGVEGDAHCGTTVKHRSRVAQNPDQPNLRQVHLIHAELFEELAGMGFSVNPGELGENITTQGVALLSLPVSTRLQLGSDALVELTGLRNPCAQIEHFQKGLLTAVLGRDDSGALVRKSGVMGIVVRGGVVRPGDTITIALPPEPHQPLERI